MERIRVASLQYFIRPVSSFEAFRDQVVSLVETAADYHCRPPPRRVATAS